MIFQMITGILTIVMIVALYLELDGWKSTRPSSQCHSILGIIAVVCTWANFITGGYIGSRQELRTGHTLLEWIHWALGNVALAFGC